MSCTEYITNKRNICVYYRAVRNKQNRFAYISTMMSEHYILFCSPSKQTKIINKKSLKYRSVVFMFKDRLRQRISFVISDMSFFSFKEMVIILYINIKNKREIFILYYNQTPQNTMLKAVSSRLVQSFGHFSINFQLRDYTILLIIHIVVVSLFTFFLSSVPLSFKPVK